MNAFEDFLCRVIPTEQSSKDSAPTPPPSPQKKRRGTQTDVTSASVTTSPPLIPTPAIKEFKYEPPKKGDVDDEDKDDYDDDDNFVENDARAYCRKKSVV